MRVALTMIFSGRRRGLKFAMFDSTLKSLCDEFASGLLSAAIDRLALPSVAPSKSDQKHAPSAAQPAWVYVCCSTAFRNSMDSGLSASLPRGARDGLESVQPNSASQNAGANAASNKHKHKHAYRTVATSNGCFQCCHSTAASDAVASEDFSSFLSLAGPTARFVDLEARAATGAAPSFPPDFTILSEKALAQLLAVVQSAGKLLSAPTSKLSNLLLFNHV